MCGEALFILGTQSRRLKSVFKSGLVVYITSNPDLITDFHRLTLISCAEERGAPF